MREDANSQKGLTIAAKNPVKLGTIQVENRFQDYSPLLGVRTLSLNFPSPHLISKLKNVHQMEYGVENWWMHFFGVWTTLSMSSGCLSVETPKVAKQILHTACTHKEKF